MNGKAARRIRYAATKTGRPARELKREYKRLPYHRRQLGVGRTNLSHREENELARKYRAWMNNLNDRPPMPGYHWDEENDKPTIPGDSFIQSLINHKQESKS